MPAPSPRTRAPFPRAAARALCALLALLACLALAGGAAAAEEATPVPANVVQPLGASDPPAVVPYKQLVGAADARNLNAAVVDTSSYWVAATDRNGHVIAAQIPRPKAGRDFGGSPVSAAAASTVGASPGRSTSPRSLRADGVTVLSPAAAAASSGSAMSGVMRFLIFRSASPSWRC